MSLQSLIDKPAELLDLIDDCLKPKQLEKKKFGEVFTPMSLVNEMLDKLPNDVWLDKNLKWFDPAVGMGNFSVAVYLRLLESLKKVIPDDAKRKRHILENMLYMSELNKKNVLLCKQIFDIKNEYKLKLHEGDTLQLNAKKKWGVDKFDIVIGNPPYQDSSSNKGNKLWTKFVEHVLNEKTGILRKNGYLVFVHPSLWRQINHPIQKLMTTNQMLYLEIHNEKDGYKTFSANTRYDWYVLKRTPCTKDTVIKDEDSKICNANISKMNFIPNSLFDLIVDLTSSDEKIEILHSESIYEPRKKWMSSTKDKEFVYPCIYSINKNNIPTFKYSNCNDKGHFGISKIIWAGGATGFIIDKDGIYGMTQWASAISGDHDSLDLIHKAMTSSEFPKIIKAISVSKQEINYKILREFNKDFYVVINKFV